MTPTKLATFMRSFISATATQPPALGKGRTRERLRCLLDLGRRDLSLARVGEAHLDAVQILTEAGRVAQPGCWYGVWAAEDPTLALCLTSAGSPVSGSLVLTGTKGFCTGAGMVDRALITVRHPEMLLVDVDMRGAPSITVETSEWATAAFAATATGSVGFDTHPVRERDVVGPPGWYLNRPGFWNGACAPASCWAGGAIGLIDEARARLQGRSGRDLLHDSALGALVSLEFLLRAVVDHAGDQIDIDPIDVSAAYTRALMLRHIVERTATETIDRFSQVMGPRALAFDEPVLRRCAELQLYIRQCHGEHDLAALGAAPGVGAPAARTAKTSVAGSASTARTMAAS